MTRDPLRSDIRQERGNLMPDQSSENRVQVPTRTAQEVMFARDHLKSASKDLAAAARYAKPYSPESSVIALHIEQQVGALTDKLDDLLAGLEVSSLMPRANTEGCMN